MELRPCGSCRRHVADAVCPFCGASVGAAARISTPLARASRAVVFGAALVACGPKAKPVEAHEERHQERRRGGGCADPDQTEIARLEQQKAEATTDEEREHIEQELQRARQPVCMPYGAPPRRSRQV